VTPRTRGRAVLLTPFTLSGLCGRIYIWLVVSWGYLAMPEPWPGQELGEQQASSPHGGRAGEPPGAGVEAIGFSDESLERQEGHPFRADSSNPLTSRPEHSASQRKGPEETHPLAHRSDQEFFDLERETFSAHTPLSDDAWFNQMMEEGVDPMVARGYLEHRRDLLSLLPQHNGEWAAYHGSERLSIGPSKTILYRKYLDEGVPARELLVLRVDEGMFPGVGFLATA
jgi:hypothetical protein